MYTSRPPILFSQRNYRTAMIAPFFSLEVSNFQFHDDHPGEFVSNHEKSSDIKHSKIVIHHFTGITQGFAQ